MGCYCVHKSYAGLQGLSIDVRSTGVNDNDSKSAWTARTPRKRPRPGKQPRAESMRACMATVVVLVPLIMLSFIRPK